MSRPGVKRFVNGVVNGVLLKPFGLRLSYRVGNDPIEDMIALVRGTPVAVVVDAGAYEGSFSRRIHRAFPDAAVHAFEPTPASYALLELRTRDIPAVARHPLALGPENGSAVLFANASPLTNSLRQSTTLGHRYFSDLVVGQGAIEVQVITLAEFAKEHAIDSIDILKLDLQGGELGAIIGLRELVDTVKILHAEVQFVELYEGAPLLADVELYLRDRGLSLYQLYDLVRSPDDGRLLYGDAMFVRNDVLEARQRYR